MDFCCTFPDVHSPRVLVSSPLSPLSTALPLRDAEQRQPGGPDVHGQPQSAPRGQATRPGRPERWARALAAYREASWQVVCLFIVSPTKSHNTFRPQDGFLSVSGLLLFRWTRRPRGRPHCPPTSPSTCSEFSSVVFPQKWSRPPTESMCPSRDVYGT